MNAFKMNMIRFVSADDAEMLALAVQLRQLQGKIKPLAKRVREMQKKELALQQEIEKYEQQQEGLLQTLREFQALKEQHQKQVNAISGSKYYTAI